MVWQTAGKARIPVVGMGGIMTGTDAAEFMIAGATAVMVGTANITDVMAGPRILRELGEFLDENGIEDARELTGSLILD
jgi:dihydroorotate dehydrogenase (NAD+) catalytic subunit